MKTTHLKLGVFALCVVLLSACSSSDDGPGADDAGAMDAGTMDSGATDAGATDAGTTDAGTTDAGTTDAGSTEPEQFNSCEVVTTDQLNETGGVIRTQLPADLSEPGSQIVLQTLPEGQIVSFDAQSGLFDFTPGASRLTGSVSYRIEGADNTVLATHEHRLVVQPVRIMPLGDSITAGVEFFDGSVDLPPMPERVGYRQFLFDRLVANGYPIDFQGQGGQSAGAAAGLADPENNGYPGVDIDFLNGKLVEQLTEDPVDIILLHIGTNNTPADAAGIDVWLDELDVWEAANQPVIALVATIVPKRDVAKNDQVNLFNADLRQRIQARSDDRVFLVEQNLAVSVDDISSEQIGLHPSAAGYQKMADTWFDALIHSGALNKCQ